MQYVWQLLLWNIFRKRDEALIRELLQCFFFNISPPPLSVSQLPFDKLHLRQRAMRAVQ